MTAKRELPRPDIVAHADWSASPGKRRVAVAVRAGNGYRVDVVAGGWLAKALVLSDAPESTFIGFDFPIGLPAKFAEAVGIDSFVEWLRGLGAPPWDRFSDVAERREEISVHRPFYPYRAVGRREHLTDALGMKWDELLRDCERPTKSRTAASPLFWTLGAKQVGRAALDGWAGILRPALSRTLARDLALWPFDGELFSLLLQRHIVLAETYPAEYYAWFMPALHEIPPGGKRAKGWREALGASLLRWCSEHGVAVSPDLGSRIRSGFGEEAGGEDDFDAVIGCVAMVRVLAGDGSIAEPPDRCRSVEGWILGCPVEGHDAV